MTNVVDIDGEDKVARTAAVLGSAETPVVAPSHQEAEPSGSCEPDGNGITPSAPGQARGTSDLRRDAEWALERALDAGDVLPLLHRLARTAPAGSEESLFAHRQLAELVAERHPWRAAIYARRVLAHRDDDDRAWAILALCQTMLGHFRCAVAAYRKALAAAPANPWYAHNLGHLLDVALGRPEEALAWLRTAYDGADWSGEVVVSFAHALARAGKISEAKRLLARATRYGASREQSALMDWIDDGAPAEKALANGASRSGRARATPGASPSRRGTAAAIAAPPPRHGASTSAASRAMPAVAGPAVAVVAPASRSSEDVAASPGADASVEAPYPVALRDGDWDARIPPSPQSPRARKRRSRRGSANVEALEPTLTRGLSNLPFDAGQRAHAVALARDAHIASITQGGAAVPSADPRSLGCVAAAIAYAIVYIDRVPLTQAEVAACFRVSVSAVRGRFCELRAKLDLTPGDVRYRTL